MMLSFTEKPLKNPLFSVFSVKSVYKKKATRT